MMEGNALWYYLISVVAEVVAGQVFAIIAGFARTAEREAEKEGHQEEKEDGADRSVDGHFGAHRRR